MGSRELKESEGIKGVCSGESAMKVMEVGERRKVCILSLAEKERLILEMYKAGRTYKEICEDLRVSPKTIAKVLRKAEEGEDVDFKFKFMAKVSQIECYLEDFSKRLSDMENRLSELEREFEGVKPLLKEVYGRIEKLTKRVDKHLEWIREHDKRIRELCHAVPGACW